MKLGEAMARLERLWADEERALAAHASAAELAPIVRAKALATDRFLHALDAVDDADRLTLRETLPAFLDAAERNAAAVGRRLELVGDLIGALEGHAARAGHRRVSRYDGAGRMADGNRAPVAIDARA